MKRTLHQRGTLIACVGLAVLLPALPGPTLGPAAAQTQTADPGVPAGTDAVDALYAVNTSDEERVEAARWLFANRRFDTLADCLADSEALPSHRAVAIAASELEEIPEPLRLALGSLLTRESVDLDTRRAVLATLGKRLDRASIRPVVESLEQSLRGAALQETISTLIRQTGRDDLGIDPARWQEWWKSVEWVTEPEWKARQSAAHAQRANRLKAERDQFESRWIESLRTIHVLTPAENRTEFLQSLLTDESIDARRLALEFVQQAVLNARPPADSVRDLVIARIEDPDAGVRALASSVAMRLAPELAAPVAFRALTNERDSAAAAAQLLLLARRPLPEATSAILAWLDDAGPAGPAAANAAAALAEVGRLQRPADRNAARTSARERLAGGDSNLAWVRLLALAGEWSDLALARRQVDDWSAIPSLADRFRDQPGMADLWRPE